MVNNQEFALQKKLRLPEIGNLHKGEHTETIPKSACDSGHLEAEAVGLNLTSNWNGSRRRES